MLSNGCNDSRVPQITSVAEPRGRRGPAGLRAACPLQILLIVILKNKARFDQGEVKSAHLCGIDKADAMATKILLLLPTADRRKNAPESLHLSKSHQSINQII